MDTRHAALCSLLLLLILHANPTSAAAAAAAVDGGAEVCKYGVPLVPFCKDWSCKAGCLLEATLLRASVKEHRCIRGGIKGICYCLFCGKHLALD